MSNSIIVGASDTLQFGTDAEGMDGDGSGGDANGDFLFEAWSEDTQSEDEELDAAGPSRAEGSGASSPAAAAGAREHDLIAISGLEKMSKPGEIFKPKPPALPPEPWL